MRFSIVAARTVLVVFQTSVVFIAVIVRCLPSCKYLLSLPLFCIVSLPCGVHTHVSMYLFLSFCLSYFYTFRFIFAFRVRFACFCVASPCSRSFPRVSCVACIYSVIRRPRGFAPHWFSPSKIETISQQTFVRRLRTTAQLGKNKYSFREQHTACSE